MSTDTETLVQGFSSLIAFLLVAAALAGPTIALIFNMRNNKKERERQTGIETEYRTKQMMLLEMTREDIAVIKESIKQQETKQEVLAEKHLIIEIDFDNHKKAVWRRIDEIVAFVGMNNAKHPEEK